MNKKINLSERFTWTWFVPRAAFIYSSLLSYNPNRNSSLVKAIKTGHEFLRLMGWDSVNFIPFKNKNTIDTGAAVFLMIQQWKSRITVCNSWIPSTPSKDWIPVDITEPFIVPGLLSSDIDDMALSRLEYVSWHYINEDRNNLRHYNFMITRLSNASSIIRFLRELFIDYHTCSIDSAFKDRLEKFILYYIIHLLPIDSFVTKVREVVAGGFVHLGDAYSTYRADNELHSKISTTVFGIRCTSSPDILHHDTFICQYTSTTIKHDLGVVRPETRDLLNLVYFINWVNTSASSRIKLEEYVIWWHDLLSRDQVDKLLVVLDHNRLACPVIVCVGTHFDQSPNYIVYHNKKAYGAKGSIEAISVFMFLMKKYHNMILNNGQRMPDFEKEPIMRELNNSNLISLSDDVSGERKDVPMLRNMLLTHDEEAIRLSTQNLRGRPKDLPETLAPIPDLVKRKIRMDDETKDEENKQEDTFANLNVDVDGKQIPKDHVNYSIYNHEAVVRSSKRARMQEALERGLDETYQAIATSATTGLNVSSSAGPLTTNNLNATIPSTVNSSTNNNESASSIPPLPIMPHQPPPNPLEQMQLQHLRKISERLNIQKI